MKFVKGVVRGKVQGVWFRRFVQQNAGVQGVKGYAKNLADGSVEVLLVGELEAVKTVQDQVAVGPPDARVIEVIWSELPEEPELEALSDFVVR